MEGSELLSIYELGGLDAESCCKFEDRGKTWLGLVLFDPDQLPREAPVAWTSCSCGALVAAVVEDSEGRPVLCKLLPKQQVGAC